MREKQMIQFGVRRLDGTIRTYYDRTTAENAVATLNRQAKGLGIAERARLLRRHVRVVQHTQPWEEVRHV